jgi:hypothetical protein
MSRTFRKKHYYTKSQFNTYVERKRNVELSAYDLWRISRGKTTVEKIQEDTHRRVDNWVKTVTTDIGCKGWKPWTRILKKVNARKARAYKRREIAKVYRDWEYDVENIKYNRHDNVWNWD